jgi:hypothetical protein
LVGQSAADAFAPHAGSQAVMTYVQKLVHVEQTGIKLTAA